MRPVLRLCVLYLAEVILAQAPGSKPVAAPPPDRFAERRAELLRTMADLKAKLQALEVELQILEEERQRATQAAPAPASDWRSSPAAAAPAVAAGRASGGEPAYGKPVKARCQAVTTAGKRCTRSAEPGSKFCWQHRH